MACEIKELEFENYGNCLSVSNGMIEAVVTIDVGPRIIYFGFIGGESEPGIPPRRTNSTGTLRRKRPIFCLRRPPPLDKS